MSGILLPRASDSLPSSAMRAFSTQFLSVVLIILTFIIGVFSSHHVKQAKHAVPVAAIKSNTLTPAIEVPERSFGSMNWGSLFSDQSAVLDSELLEPLSQVLRSHDILLRVTVAEDSPASIELALARSSSLLRYFLAQGIPPAALEIVTSEEERPWQVQVEFWRQKVNELS